jgi:hypothetical protein
MDELKNSLMSGASNMSGIESDGLDSFDLSQIGMQGSAFGSAKLLKFVTDHYATREGEVIGPEREFVVLGLKKIILKFVGGKLAEPPIIVPDGKKAPDIEAMNKAAQREEWGVSLDGKPCGPYTLFLVLQLLDTKTMDLFAFNTSSKGGKIGKEGHFKKASAATQRGSRKTRMFLAGGPWTTSYPEGPRGAVAGLPWLTPQVFCEANCASSGLNRIMGGPSLRLDLLTVSGTRGGRNPQPESVNRSVRLCQSGAHRSRRLSCP